ncbi:MAG TPA: cytochrome c [Nostocaceae cyanobacterium]|nr:cytochrome c [Nostocaceae cyanobacterium]
MDNQLTKPETLIQQVAVWTLTIITAIAVALFGIQMVQASDPYVQSVLSLKGDPVRGQAIFHTNCAGCHAWDGTGLVGPSLQEVSKRKSPYGLIHQVTSGDTPPMPKFQPKPKDMADLLSYLESL